MVKCVDYSGHQNQTIVVYIISKQVAPCKVTVSFSQSKSLPGRTRNREIYEVVTEAQEKGNRNRNDNSDFKESEDVNDFGLGSLSTPVMGESQQPIVSMDDDEFPSEEEKVSFLLPT